jgi:hypothetical protein
MAFTYEVFYERLLKMTPEQFLGHWVCRADNLKRGVLKEAHSRAMMDVRPIQLKQAEEKYKREREEEMKRLQEAKIAGKKRARAVADEDEDPRILAGTHQRVFEKQKCGGKGQVMTVPVIVPVEDE